MTVDATKSPTPAWQRKVIGVLLAVLVAVVAYMVWTKDLHHQTPATSSPPVATTPATTPGPTKTQPVSTTTIPGGLPVSSRDPFGN